MFRKCVLTCGALAAAFVAFEGMGDEAQACCRRRCGYGCGYGGCGYGGGHGGGCGYYGGGGYGGGCGYYGGGCGVGYGGVGCGGVGYGGGCYAAYAAPAYPVYAGVVRSPGYVRVSAYGPRAYYGSAPTVSAAAYRAASWPLP